MRCAWGRPLVLLVVAASMLAGGCEPTPRAQLVVEIDGPILAYQFIRRDCPAGWYMGGSLRLRETGGVDVLLERLTFHLTDAENAPPTGGDGNTFDWTRQVLPYEVDPDLAAMGEKVFRLGAGSWSSRPVGPITVWGEVSGLDHDGNAVAQSFRLNAPLLVEGQGVPPCGP